MTRFSIKRPIPVRAHGRHFGFLAPHWMLWEDQEKNGTEDDNRVNIVTHPISNALFKPHFLFLCYQQLAKIFFFIKHFV